LNGTNPTEVTVCGNAVPGPVIRDCRCGFTTLRGRSPIERGVAPNSGCLTTARHAGEYKLQAKRTRNAPIELKVLTKAQPVNHPDPLAISEYLELEHYAGV
jgi:hypothetical protein